MFDAFGRYEKEKIAGVASEGCRAGGKRRTGGNIAILTKEETISKDFNGRGKKGERRLEG